MLLKTLRQQEPQLTTQGNDLKPNSSKDAWSTHDAIHTYGLDRWGRGFFSINSQGRVSIQTLDRNGMRTEFDLGQIVDRVASRGQQPPLIVRFPGIIRQRILDLNSAFAKAISEFNYGADYRLIYPIKVNQHAEVLDAVLQPISAEPDHADPIPIGLESGSKAELLTVVAKSSPGNKILCNGFKDPSMVELAFRAFWVGQDVTIVVEKLSDIDLIAAASNKFPVLPKIGLRTKLGWRGAGHWRSSNGRRSKFGLAAAELIEAVKMLRERRLLHQVHLLHFHPGSQINDVREIKSALTEVTRVYVDLVNQGVPLDTIDVGGGLAVDYTGNQNCESSSMNYTLQEYANDVVYYIKMVCDQAEVPHPHLYSESGRAITAHHSILVVPVFDNSDRFERSVESTPEQNLESPSKTVAPIDSDDANLQSLRELQAINLELQRQLTRANKANHRLLSEAYHDAQQALETSLQLFVNGHMTLLQRAQAEQAYLQICRKIREVLYQLDFVPDELAQTRDLLADTYLANFSVFQSLPDYWAIDQLFPVMPIHRLDQRPTRRGVVGDITCDSDGILNRFLGHTSGKNHSLPLHPFDSNEPYWLGVFLVGAYQEALSDDHNLLGKFHTICVDGDEAAAGGAQATDKSECDFLEGSQLREVIEHVNHDWSEMRTRFKAACQAAHQQDRLDSDQLQETVEFFEELANDYTYLNTANLNTANLNTANLNTANLNALSGSDDDDCPQFGVPNFEPNNSEFAAPGLNAEQNSTEKAAKTLEGPHRSPASPGDRTIESGRSL